ncbi:MAG TPA: hypothetical protein VIM64_16930 [Puia sp.]
MKNNNKIFSAACITLLMLAGMVSCKKSSYLEDGGVHNPHTPLSTYDYLKNQAYHDFDSTIMLIDHFNLKDSVNKAGTFFAPTDYAINGFMINNHLSSMQMLYDFVSSRLLTQYMFSQHITLDNVTTDAVVYQNWASDTVLSAVRKVANTYPVYLTNSVPSFTYYTLQYVWVNDPVDIYLSCQTTGILTSSGTTLHVLVDNALLRRL